MGADSPGFRHGDYAAGRLYYIGYNGFCYSSSVIDTHAHYLGFAPGGVYSQSNNRRSYGFQLRCLQGHPKGVLLAIRWRNWDRA